MASVSWAHWPVEPLRWGQGPLRTQERHSLLRFQGNSPSLGAADLPVAHQSPVPIHCDQNGIFRTALRGCPLAKKQSGHLLLRCIGGRRAGVRAHVGRSPSGISHSLLPWQHFIRMLWFPIDYQKKKKSAGLSIPVVEFVSGVMSERCTHPPPQPLLGAGPWPPLGASI